MQVNGVPNKYEIFQEYYLETNGKEISYSEALSLFSQLNAEEKSDFEQYYKDETGYEIISSSGYNLEPNINIEIDSNGKVKRDENGNVISNLSALKKYQIFEKYSIEAYAKGNGLILDPIWSGYSAQEIILMKNNGVNIPQDIVDIANTILESTGINYESTASDSEATTNDTTEKLPYLELIPKVATKIQACEDNNEKLNSELDKILPKQQKQEKALQETIENRKQYLNEYESYLREWNQLEDKLNNGQVLTEREQARYKELKSIISNNNDDSVDFEIDKNEIAKSLSEINIYSTLGEELANDTIEIADTLADYTSQTNYKTTYKNASQQIGFLRAIIAMAQGKTLSTEATKIAGDTKDNALETKNFAANTASTLGMNISADINENTQKPAKIDTENTTENNEEQTIPQKTQDEITKDEEVQNNPEIISSEGNNTDPNAVSDENIQNGTETEQKEENTKVFTDEEVLNLIKEGQTINAELAKQIIENLAQDKVSQEDFKTAANIDKRIKVLVQEFLEEENKRQKEIQKKEKENTEANKTIETITGKNNPEIQQYTNKNSNESTNKEVEKQKQIIADNNKDINSINKDSEIAIEKFKQDTVEDRSTIDKLSSTENAAQKDNNTYLQQTLPQQTARMDYINYAGVNLATFGSYQVSIGQYQVSTGLELMRSIATLRIGAILVMMGIKNVTEGNISIGIGTNAINVSTEDSLIDEATTSANSTSTTIGTAVNQINVVKEEVASVTKEGNNPQNNETNTTPTTTNGNENNNETTNAENTQTEEIQTNTNTNNTTETSSENTTAETNANNIISTATVSPDNTNVATINANNTTENEAGSTTENTEEKTETDPDDAQKSVDTIDADAKDAGKDSKEIKKDSDKSKKELEKETKQLTKEMKKDQQEAIKMTQESEKAAKRQQEILTEYEGLVAENETLTAEDTASSPQQPQTQAAGNNALATNNMGIIVGAQAVTGNSDRILSNNNRINELGTEFSTLGRTITTNSTKIQTIQKNTQKNQKAFEKKTKTIQDKIKAEQKSEEDKQKRLSKQLGAVGIAENVFSITTSTGIIMNKVGTAMITSGTSMLSNPFTAAAGAALIASGTPIQVTGVTLTTVGTYGTVACGVTKATINIANGNLAAGLISLGQTAVSAATSITGIGGAANSTLQAVSAGLNIVSSTADLANNVKAVQGKEANGALSKISTIAGAASSITGAASSMATDSFKQTNTFGKVMTSTTLAGTVLSSTSELMTEFGADNKAAEILGMVGGAASTIGSVSQLLNNKFNQESSKNNENQEQQKVNETNNEDSPEVKAAMDKKIQEMQAQIDADLQAELAQLQQQIPADNGITQYQPIDNTQQSQSSALLSDLDMREMQGIGIEQTDLQITGKIQGMDISKAQPINLESTNSSSNNLEKIMQGLNAASNVAGQLFNKNNQNQNETAKKQIPAGQLSEEAKEIIKKHRRRIAALSKMKYST